MEWLANNWLWILVGIGFFWFMCGRRAGMGCCGGGHSHGPHTEDSDKEAEAKPISSKGGCH
jgi:hypothetical protein